jgi:hypothetical protein
MWHSFSTFLHYSMRTSSRGFGRRVRTVLIHLFDVYFQTAVDSLDGRSCAVLAPADVWFVYLVRSPPHPGLRLSCGARPGLRLSCGSVSSARLAGEGPSLWWSPLCTTQPGICGWSFTRFSPAVVYCHHLLRSGGCVDFQCCSWSLHRHLWCRFYFGRTHSEFLCCVALI